MTSKTSLFNFGIYSNTIHRFKWGSFLYFIILFFSVPFVFMTQTPTELLESYNPKHYPEGGLILKQSFITIPYLLALVVPTVVALLTFHNVHSSKQGVFTHSIPVTRKAYYISSLLGGFSLMLAPVLLNGIILLMMSLFGYGKSFAPWSIGCWIAVQTAVLFVMFSVASFSAFLTGNGVAHAVINVLIHTFPLLVAGAIVLVSEVFLFGFTQSDYFIAEEIMENTPLVWLFTRLVQEWSFDLEMFKSVQLWIYIVGAAAVYALGYLLYKNRKIEACGDVAAFRVFRPILKYTITAATALAVLAMLWAMELGAVATFIVAAALSAIVYFVCEMLMSKTFKVFGTYKGFAVFAVCSALVISFCAYTSIFGYETRIPAEDKIAKAAIFTGYYNSDEAPLVEDAEAISAVRSFHKEFINDIPVTERGIVNAEDFRGYYISVKYSLKNGRSLERRYLVPEEQSNKALAKMYEFNDYKMQVSGLDKINVENLKNANLGVYSSNFSYHISLNEDAAELLNAIKSDIERLSFEEINGRAYHIEFNVSFSLTQEENEEQKVFKEGTFGEYAIAEEIQSFDITLNPNFTNAMNVLKQKGYLDTILANYADSLWICKEPFYKAGEMCTYKDDKGYFSEFYASIDDCVQLSAEDALRLAKELMASERSDTPDGKSYFVFNRSRNADANLWFASNAICYAEEKLPDYLEKYINN